MMALEPAVNKKEDRETEQPQGTRHQDDGGRKEGELYIPGYEDKQTFTTLFLFSDTSMKKQEKITTRHFL